MTLTEAASEPVNPADPADEGGRMSNATCYAQRILMTLPLGQGKFTAGHVLGRSLKTSSVVRQQSVEPADPRALGTPLR